MWSLNMPALNLSSLQSESAKKIPQKVKVPKKLLGGIFTNRKTWQGARPGCLPFAWPHGQPVAYVCMNIWTSRHTNINDQTKQKKDSIKRKPKTTFQVCIQLLNSVSDQVLPPGTVKWNPSPSHHHNCHHHLRHPHILYIIIHFLSPLRPPK